MGELGADLGEGFGERAAGVGREQLGEIGAAAAGVEAALAGQRELAGAGLRGEQPDLAEHLAGGDPVARAVGGVAGVAAGGPREQERGAGGEIQLTDSMIKLMSDLKQAFHAVRFDGTIYDCGSKIGFLAANVAYAMARPDLAAALRGELKKLI